MIPNWHHIIQTSRGEQGKRRYTEIGGSSKPCACCWCQNIRNKKYSNIWAYECEGFNNASPFIPKQSDNNQIRKKLGVNLHSLAGVNVLQWSPTTVRLVVAVQKLLGKTVDAVLHYWVSCKLRRLLVPQRIAHLIQLLQCKFVF